MVKMEKRIAVYGGAFDPLTVAHEAIIEYLLENYPEVHVYLTENDEKRYNASFQDRYGMLITRFPKLNIHKQSVRTFDLLEAVYGTYVTGSEKKDPGIDLIIGMDELEALLAGKWKDSEKLINKYSIRVFNRGRNFNFHTELGDRGDIKPIFVNVPDVSSTAVRSDMFMNPMYEGTAVSPQVLGYIFQHGLYHQDNPVTHWADEYRELANYEPGDYPKPSVTVTSVVINGIGEPTIGREDQVLLVRRKKFPFANYWCLPGGFTNPHESVEESAARELNEETGLQVDVGLFRQLKVYLPDDPRADLRYRANNEDRQADELVERGSYLANIDGIRAYAKELRNHWVYDVGVYVRGTFGPVKGDDDAAEAAWFPLSVARRTRLAFHHNQILEDYVKAIGR